MITGAAWPVGALRSPLSGRVLHPRPSRSPDALLMVAGNETWPVIDGIPYLRLGRDGLVAQAVEAIEAGDVNAATCLLLTDQDPYAPDPPPTAGQCRMLVERRDTISLREAMQLLAYGRVGDYFAHRWSDPTFLSGLLLLEQALPRQTGGCVFELACGIGHFLAVTEGAGMAAAGGDIVFSKLWVARHFISPRARLVCFDAAEPWPLLEASADALFCHDAFYFLPDKQGIAERMRALVGAGGTIAIGHAHNASAANHSAGAALRVAEYACLFPHALLLDDAELTAAFAANRVPLSTPASRLESADAIAMLSRPSDGGELVAARRVIDPDAPMRLNPLYRQDGPAWRIDWPSPRYRDEYAALATYPAEWSGSAPKTPDERQRARQTRTHVALPARW